MKIISADRFGSNFPKIIKNTSATIFIRGCFGIARILLLLLIARKFGPNDFGALSLALSVVEIFRLSPTLAPIQSFSGASLSISCFPGGFWGMC